MEKTVQQMSDEEYKAFVIEKYGDIKGLAKTLLTIRKDTGEKAGDSGDEAVYQQVKAGVDRARKLLNWLHARLCYAEKEKTYEDVPYGQVIEALEEAAELIAGARSCAASRLERQNRELKLDYIDY